MMASIRTPTNGHGDAAAEPGRNGGPDLRTGVDDADYRIHFRDVRLYPVLEGGVKAAWGRLLDNNRLRRWKLNLGNGGDLGNWKLRR